MNDYWATKEEISEAAASTFEIVYGGKSKSLTSMWLDTNFIFLSYSKYSVTTTL